jgi:hypothetical protein
MGKTIVKTGYFFLLLPAAGQTEIGPEGFKLLLVVLIIAAFVLFTFIRNRIRQNKNYTHYKVLRKKEEVEINLEKNRLYFPDFLTLTIHNTGKADIDIARPLLVFKNLMMERKFKLSGLNNYHFYPLYLVAGKTHTLRIDLERFYGYDKRLKRFPKVTVLISNVKGKKLGKKSIMLRKTLFR